ncbi:MAG: hypothetical protein KatS3mg111_1472 [Pirellulaceae bacterium]|nr:MAG: hypothetical protein KatS3mg111_1472 [Pirellulaceae bacterium]
MTVLFWLSLLPGRILLAQSAEDCQARLLEHRAALKSGDFQVHVTRFQPRKQEFHYRIVFSGDRFRVDVTKIDETGHEYVMKRVKDEATRKSIVYSNERYHHGGRNVVSIEHLTPSFDTGYPTHPRVYGFSTGRFSGWYSVPIPPWKGQLVEERRVTLDGVPGIVMATYQDGSVQRTFYFDPTRSCEIVRKETAVRDQFERLVVTLKEIDGFGWFPMRTEFSEGKTEADIKLVETVEIIPDRVNEQIDPTLFTLQGLEIPDGYPVYDRTGESGSKRFVYFDGELIQRDQLAAKSSESNLRWYIGLFAVIAGVIAIVVSYRSYRATRD